MIQRSSNNLIVSMRHFRKIKLAKEINKNALEERDHLFTNLISGELEV